jgi:outer membrane receptor protein involved in Fe transport
MPKNRGWTHALWAAPLTVAIAGPVMAQAPAAEPAVLDEIVVTARKREESLIEVPLAVTAVTAEQITREGIRDVEGIIERDPSLSFDLGMSPTRGRPNVATLVDGIDVSSEASGVAGGSLLINPKLIDVAQIEIVKGPQSALYGRSAFSGAISYTTKDPDDELSGEVFADLNDRSQSDLKASISLPLTDELGVRLSGYKFKDSGFYRNADTGSRIGGGDGQGGALTVKWAPGEAFSLKFRAEYSDDAFDPAPQAALAFNTTNPVPANASICNVGTAATAAGGTTPAPVGFVIDRNCPQDAARLALGLNAYRELDRLTGGRGIFDDMAIPAFNGNVGSASGLTPSFNRDLTKSTDNGNTAPDFEGSDRQVTRLSTVMDFQTGFGTFASLTGYTKAQVHTNFDIDKTSFLPIQQTLKTDTTTEQFSQELRFTSDFDGPVNFFAGVQYWTERNDQLELNNTVIAAGTTCFATDLPGPAPVIESAPGMAGPITIPAGSCTNPTGGYTFTSAAPFMDDVAALRGRAPYGPSWVRRTVDHLSGYLDVEWKIVEQLKVIAEARYVDEDNFVSAGFTDGSNGPGTVTLCGSNGPCRNGAGVPAPGFPPILFPMGFAPAATTRQIEYPTLNEKYWSPKGTIQWQPTEDLNIYGSYAQARKPGGYSTVTIGGAGAPANGDDIKFEAEKLNVSEIGAKWRGLGGRMLLTGAVFRNDFTDKQVGTQVLVGNTISNRVTNAGKAVIDGLELGAQFRPSENWLLGAGLTYFFKYEYTDYKTTSTGAGEIARVGNCTIGYLGADGGFVALGSSPIPVGRSLTCQLDRTGNFIEDTPELAAAINIGYRRPVGSGDTTLFVDLDANWQDERFLEDDNTAWLDSYYVANLRLGLETQKWSAQLYVDNITDDRTVRSAGTGPAIYASDFRLGVFTYFPGPGAPLQRNVFAPSIPTTTFADLPRPITFGMRFSYKF